MSARTPLTYFGGKQSIADRIVELMPPHDIYLEPFAGGAAVLFRKPPAKREILNDKDGAIMAFWRAVRDHRAELAQAVSLTPYAREEWRACMDGLDEPGIPDVERARRLIVTIDQSFARTGDNWSPPSVLRDRRGRWQPGTFLNIPDKIVAAASRLQGVCLENHDALHLIKRVDFDRCVIYADPPYGGEHRRDPSKGYRHDITDELWPELVDALLQLERAAVLLSGYPNGDAERLEAAGWITIKLDKISTAGNRSHRAGQLAPERLWINPVCAHANAGDLFGTVAS